MAKVNDPFHDINKDKWYRTSDNVWLDKMNHCIVGEKYKFWTGDNVEIIVTDITINREKFSFCYWKGTKMELIKTLNKPDVNSH